MPSHLRIQRPKSLFPSFSFCSQPILIVFRIFIPKFIGGGFITLSIPDDDKISTYSLIHETLAKVKSIKLRNKRCDEVILKPDKYKLVMLEGENLHHLDKHCVVHLNDDVLSQTLKKKSYITLALTQKIPKQKSTKLTPNGIETRLSHDILNSKIRDEEEKINQLKMQITGVVKEIGMPFEKELYQYSPQIQSLRKEKTEAENLLQMKEELRKENAECDKVDKAIDEKTDELNGQISLFNEQFKKLNDTATKEQKEYNNWRNYYEEKKKKLDDARKKLKECANPMK